MLGFCGDFVVILVRSQITQRQVFSQGNNKNTTVLFLSFDIWGGEVKYESHFNFSPIYICFFLSLKHCCYSLSLIFAQSSKNNNLIGDDVYRFGSMPPISFCHKRHTFSGNQTHLCL